MSKLDLLNKSWLIDLDGTMYHGDHAILDADRFIATLKNKNFSYRFVTNNSSATPEDVAAKLRSHGIEASAADVCTSAQATAQYISNQLKGAKVYVIGENGLRLALEQKGLNLVDDEQPDFVVQGIDRSLTYEKVERAVTFIRNGAISVMTNPDLLLPSTNGFIPGAGSIGAMIEQASGVKPIIIGKPSSILINYALEDMKTNAQQAVVVGDNMSTDIRAGIDAGCQSILLFTGLTNAENYHYYKEKAGCEPTIIIDTMAELISYIEKY